MDTLRKISARFNIPLVTLHADRILNLEEFLENAKDMEDTEGFVLRFADGHMAKIKTSWYVQLHKAVAAVQFEKDVWLMALDDNLDDVKPFVDPDVRERLDQFASALFKAMEDLAEKIKWDCIAWKDNKGDSQKKFAVEFVNNSKNGIPSKLKGVYFKVWLGADAFSILKDLIKNHTGSQTKIDEIRPVLGGIKFNRYGDEQDG